jgi:hypothetical protein
MPECIEKKVRKGEGLVGKPAPPPRGTSAGVSGRYPGSQVLTYRLPRFPQWPCDTPALAYRCGVLKNQMATAEAERLHLRSTMTAARERLEVLVDKLPEDA